MPTYNIVKYVGTYDVPTKSYETRAQRPTPMSMDAIQNSAASAAWEQSWLLPLRAAVRYCINSLRTGVGIGAYMKDGRHGEPNIYHIFGMVSSELSQANLILHDPGEFYLGFFSYH